MKIELWKYIIGYYIITNVFSFFLFWIDKRKAIKRKERISENSLIFSGFISGGICSFLSMHLLHHKTKKWKFKILIPMCIIIHFIIWMWYYIVSL